MQNNKKGPKTTIQHIKIQQPQKAKVMTMNKSKTNMEILMDDHGSAVTITAFLVGLLGIGWGILSVHNAHANEQAGRVVMVQKVNDYKNLQKEYKKVANTPGIDISSGTDSLVSGTKRGDQLARLQNEYATAGSSQKAIRRISKGISALMATSSEETTPWYYTGNKKMKALGILIVVLLLHKLKPVLSLLVQLKTGRFLLIQLLIIWLIKKNLRMLKLQLLM